MTTAALGLDFGTTNSVVALGDGAGGSSLAVFAAPGGPSPTFRSALSFQAAPNDPAERVVEAGPWAIDAYAEDPLDTRFIQSFKTYGASPLFSETTILRKRFSFEDLLAAFLLKLQSHGGEALKSLPPRVIVGRPVAFAGASPDPDLALRRYQDALRRLGFEDIWYAYEPVAAAFFFARQLTADATVLVADFGGGTSDFSIVRFERRGGRIVSKGLANSGVGVAGDAFDYRIIDNLVSPALGKGSSYRAFDNVLPIPNRYYTAFARWEQLALLRQSKDMRDIRGLERTALEPDKIAALIEVLDENYGYPLYRAVSALKEQLSASQQGRFAFQAGGVDITADVTRRDFESWIAPELAAMDAAVGAALDRAALTEAGIDKVFLTGGSSFVPAVRRLFERRFGAAKLEGGSELVSIASGLALIGAEGDLSAWCMRAPA